MPYIIGTAGHIDHGKTSLIKALTGTDTDRLKEEKERGISIDLGFAHLDLPDGTSAGIVDVPGHERLIKNMLAGAHGIDVALGLCLIKAVLGRDLSEEVGLALERGDLLLGEMAPLGANVLHDHQFGLLGSAGFPRSIGRG